MGIISLRGPLASLYDTLTAAKICYIYIIFSAKVRSKIVGLVFKKPSYIEFLSLFEESYFGRA